MKDNNYALITIPAGDDSHIEDAKTHFVLIITSGHDHNAHAVSPSIGVIIDCGTSSYFSPDRSKFLDYEDIDPEPIKATNGHAFSAISKGDIRVTLPACKGIQNVTIHLKGVYYAPSIAFILISVSCLDHTGCSLLIEDEICVIRGPHPKCATLSAVPLICGLYRINPSYLVKPPTHHANAANIPMSINELHRRLGHLNFRTLREMVSKGAISGITLEKSSEAEFCSACVQGKAHHKAFPKESQTTYTVYSEKVVVDLRGPAQVNSLDSHCYYQLYHNMWTHEDRINFLKKKSEAFKRYLKYEAWVKVQRNTVIKCLGSDGGGEYISKEFKDYLESVGMAHHLTICNSPQSNSTAERGNRTHVKRACTMMITAGLPEFLWAEAIHHSIWLGMWTPSHALPEFITPLEKATRCKPDLQGVLEWGIPIWVKRADTGKLDPRAVEGHFVGYDEEEKGYQVYWAARHSISIERDVYIDKNAVLEPGDIVFEEEDLLTSNPSQVSNLMVPETQPTLKPIKTPIESLPMSDIPTVLPTPLPKICRGSLAGLLQYDANTYGCGKHQSKKGVVFVESALVLDNEESLAPGGVIVEPLENSDWFCNAVQDAMSAITEDQPHINEVIKGPESNQ